MKLISENFKFSPWQYYLLVVLIGILPLFYHLGQPVLSIWDESRRAVNAYEMYENGNLLVTHFNGEPEMWGTKPPLLIWMQTLSMHVFGVNEFALRFPSALAGLLLGFLIIWFSNYYTKSYLFGLIAVLILYTSRGYIALHSVRTADFDSVLILFTTAASFFLFLGTEAMEKKDKNRFILLFFIMLALAALTKGIAAFILGPAYLVFLLYRKDLKNWLTNKYLYIGFAILIAMVGGYYFLREIFNPGYLRAMMENEITGRYFETLEQNKRPFSFYFKMLYQHRFKDWYYLIPTGIFLAYIGKDIKIKRLITYLILLTLTYIFVISIGETKLEWYDLPVFPFISLMTALFFYFVIKALSRYSLLKDKRYSKYISIVILVFFFAAPYYRVYKSISSGEVPKQEESTHRISHYLRGILNSETEPPGGFTVLYEGEFQHFLLYIYKLRDQGHEVYFKEPVELSPNEKYIVYQEDLLEKLENRYNAEIVSEEDGIYEVFVE